MYNYFLVGFNLKLGTLCLYDNGTRVFVFPPPNVEWMANRAFNRPENLIQAFLVDSSSLCFFSMAAAVAVAAGEAIYLVS